MLRYFILVLAAASLAAVPLTAEEGAKPPTLADLAWLVGDWEGTGGTAEFDEHWIPAKGGLMLGVGRWVKDGKAVAFEYMRIFEGADGIRFTAQPGGKPGTTFKATQVDAHTVVFENPKNDFPKVIRYVLVDKETLEARISNSADGSGPSQAFRMKKK